MESWSWFGANIPKRARESKLLALLLQNLRPARPVQAAELSAPSERETGGRGDAGDDNEGDDNGGLGWTAGLSRGADLPPLRLSMRPDSRLAGSLRAESGRLSAMRFEPFCAPDLTETQREIRGGR